MGLKPRARGAHCAIYALENGVDADHIIEIALDGIESEELRDPKVCFKFIKDAMKDDGKYYLLLDEVQFMPRFEEVLNSLLRMSNIDVYVTGSNSKFLSSDIVTEFRGRGDEIRIYPLSFAEFYSAYDGDYDDAWVYIPAHENRLHGQLEPL